jgi:hypothetical protein
VRDPHVVLLAGVAAGLAAGTKLTVLVPLAVLAIGLRASWRFVVPALSVGGFWYARNLAVT